MRTDKDKKGSMLFTRAVVALAFAFAVCLPTTAAFAATSEDGVAVSGEPAAPAVQAAEETVVNTSEETQEAGGQGLTPVFVQSSEQVVEQAPASDGEQVGLVAGTLLDEQSEGAANLEAQDAVSLEWLQQRYVLDGQDDANRTIVLKEYEGSGVSDDPDSDITVPGKVTIGDVEYTTVVSQGTFDNDSYRGKEKLQSITFKDGVKVIDGSSFFAGFKALTTVDAAGLDLSECTSMKEMFYDCESLSALDLTGWDASGVTDMSGMFA